MPDSTDPSASGGSDRARVELERTLGLPEAFAIGIGTMVGAGIFGDGRRS